MFFGIIACPSPDDSVPEFTASGISTKQSAGVQTAASDSTWAVPEPITLLLFGSGLIALGVIGRKNFKK